MKSIIFYFGILCILVSCKSNSQVTSGVVIRHNYVVNKDLPDSIISEGPVRTKVYFLDSTVIYEIRILKLSDNDTDIGKGLMSRRPILKYTYLDLRTMIAQDYLNFHDSAKPKLSYPLLKDQIVSWGVLCFKSNR